MALATQCPHCSTTFRVASDQLKLRGGIVRCGACHQIFDGNAALIDFDEHAAGQAAPPPSAAEPAASPPAPVPEAETTAAGTTAPASDAAPPDSDEVPIYTLDFDHTFDPFGILPKLEAQDEDAQAGAPPRDADAAQIEHDAAHPVAESDAPPSVAAAVADSTPAPAHEDSGAPTTVDAENPVESVAEAPAEIAAATASDPAASTAAPAPQHPTGNAMPASDEPGATDTALAAAPSSAPAAHAAPLSPAAGDATTTFAAEAPGTAPADSTSQRAVRAAGRPRADAVATQPRQATAPDSARLEPTLGLQVDEELVAAALPGDEYDDERPAAPSRAPRSAPAEAPLLLRESADDAARATPPAAPKTPRAKAAEARSARRSKLTPTKIPQPRLRVPDIDEPEFVRVGRQREQSGRTRRIAFAIGSAVLLLVLAAQAAITFRHELAARVPSARPALTSACALFGCRVELPAKIDNLVIETGELTTTGANTYAFTTLLRNQGDLPQAWPSIELTLTDADDKPLLRRVFGPREYLALGSTANAGFGPRAEQPVKLHFELDQLKPSGYRIAVFYP
jgi:predicted Zn finger-like uncharacterized protein